ncbi:MAG: hypothetical protein HN931_09655, partial [Desulfobacterales bacterium]|nr:hypothetical protein [Desulfobacterales bacterium]
NLWHDSVHRTRTQFKANGENGHGLLIGDDFQRSPGFGGFTFAVGITPVQGGTAISGTIARQSGLWSLKLKNNTVRLAMGNWRVESPVTLVDGCNRFIVTGDFSRRTSNWKGDDDVTSIKLLVNGQELLSVNERGKLKDEEYLKNPTYLGQDADGKERLNAVLSRAIMLNKKVSAEPPLSIQELEGKICGQTQLTTGKQ